MEGNNTTAIAVKQAVNIQDVKQGAETLAKVLADAMQEGVDYGIIPGCGNKPALLKPGAEKLCSLYHLAPKYTVERIDSEKGHREYIITCSLTHIETGLFVGEGLGSCSTMEKKFRTRNPIEDQYNTVLKIGKKRSLIDATLTATHASALLTQDIDEMVEYSDNGRQPQPKDGKIDTEFKRATRKDFDEWVSGGWITKKEIAKETNRMHEKGFSYLTDSQAKIAHVSIKNTVDGRKADAKRKAEIAGEIKVIKESGKVSEGNYSATLKRFGKEYKDFTIAEAEELLKKMQGLVKFAEENAPKEAVIVE